MDAPLGCLSRSAECKDVVDPPHSLPPPPSLSVCLSVCLWVCAVSSAKGRGQTKKTIKKQTKTITMRNITKSDIYSAQNGVNHRQNHQNEEGS